MTARPLVSIIIPALNSAPWIGETLKSCFGQTWQNVEVIVVDNGSTDETKEIVRSMAPAGIQLYECVKPGASAARNMGTARSRGTYIQYLDADDILAPSKIEIQVSRLLKNDPDLIASGPWVRFEKELNEQKVSPEPVWQDLTPDGFLIRSWSGGGMMPIFSWLTPRSIVERVGQWNETLTVDDDGEFFTRVVLQSSGIRFCPDAMGYYRTTSRPSLSKGTSLSALMSELSSINLCTKRLLMTRADPEARRACAYLYQRFAYHAYPFQRDLAELAEQRAREEGGCDLAPPGGKSFQVLSAVLGWKRASRVRHSINH
jgi:glycosyltransferase involved in cell wall biosynthesis